MRAGRRDNRPIRSVHGRAVHVSPQPYVIRGATPATAAGNEL
ncbi:hypothetical protein BN2537_15055 [Streptomyces venezuelae]|nr:hypothetical protein BN2537_15055 [Streptomyces venezuelae]